jgi:hypothetical protein
MQHGDRHKKSPARAGNSSGNERRTKNAGSGILFLHVPVYSFVDICQVKPRVSHGFYVAQYPLQTPRFEVNL